VAWVSSDACPRQRRAQLLGWRARLGQQTLGAGLATGAATSLANGVACAGPVHSQLGEQREAISCCRQALDLVGERKNPMARGVLVIMLAEFGDACPAVGGLPTAIVAWRQVAQVLDGLGWPDLLGVGARLKRAGLPGPQG